MLGGEFFAAAARSGAHLEVETYTFDVLPPPHGDVSESIAAELQWVASRLEAAAAAGPRAPSKIPCTSGPRR
jgi:hypothetical protein